MSNHESNQIAINALVNRRKELVFDLGEKEKEVAEIQKQIFHIGETIKVLDPSVALEALPLRHRRGTKSPYFEHSEMTKRVYAGMRENPAGTVTSEGLALAAMDEKGLNSKDDGLLLNDFENRFRRQLEALRRDGKIKKVQGRGPTSEWALVERS